MLAEADDDGAPGATAAMEESVSVSRFLLSPGCFSLDSVPLSASCETIRVGASPCGRVMPAMRLVTRQLTPGRLGKRCR